MLEFRLGWNFRSFLAFLHECLELEVEQARRLLLLPADNQDGESVGEEEEGKEMRDGGRRVK